MQAKSWLWPDRTIGKRESRTLRDEHNAVVNQNAAMLEALRLVAGMLDNFPGFDSRAVPFTNEPTGNIGQVVSAAIRKATGEES